MSTKSQLIKEIYMDKKVNSNLITSYFENREDEIDYLNYTGPRSRLYQLIGGLFLLLYNITNTYYIFQDSGLDKVSYKIFIKILFVCFAILNVIFLIIMIKSSLNSIVNKISTYSKLIINLIGYFYYIYFLISFKNPDEKEYERTYSIIRNLYMQAALFMVEYLFLIKPCRLIGYIFSFSEVGVIIYLNFIVDDKSFLSVFVPELLASLLLFILVEAANYFDKMRRKTYNYIKQTENFSNYFETLLSNMQFHLISYCNDKLVLYNESYKSFIKEENIESYRLHNNHETKLSIKNNTQSSQNPLNQHSKQASIANMINKENKNKK